jgi:hypothetical protein
MFTSELGTPQSELGNIVLGVVNDQFNLYSFGFSVHEISSNQIRILFNTPVTNSALNSSFYILSSPGQGVTSVVPTLNKVEFYDSTLRSVVLTYALDLTTGQTYSMQILGVQNFRGLGVSGSPVSFVANVINPPVATGAFLSKRGCVDIVFNKNVGLSSNAATASIRDSSGGSSVPMTLLDWSTEPVLANNSVRFQLPISMPIANSFSIDFANIVDDSLNVGSGTIELTVTSLAPPPYGYYDLTQIQMTKAIITDVSNDIINAGNVRVYFNTPTQDASDTHNWSLQQQGPHIATDTINQVTVGDSGDLPTVIFLVNSLKSKINAHFILNGVHTTNDTTDTIVSPDASDLASVVTLLNEIQLSILTHFKSTSYHIYNDIYDIFYPIVIAPTDLVSAINIANIVKYDYNSHLQPFYSLRFNTVFETTPTDDILDFSRLSMSSAFPVESQFTYYADLHVNLISNKVPVSVTCTIISDDGGSSTNPSNVYYGTITAVPVNSQASILSNEVRVDRSVSIVFDHEMLINSDGYLSITSNESPVEISGINLTATLPNVVNLLNQLVFSYSYHIDPNPAINAGHLNVDTVNLVTDSNYSITPTLSDILSKVNAFAVLVNSHMSSNIWHYHAEYNLINSPQATDFDSMITLLSEIRTKFLEHDINVGPHSYPGWIICSAPLFNRIEMKTNMMVDGSQYILDGSVKSVYRENNDGEITPGSTDRIAGSNIFNNFIFSSMFIGAATHPSLASVVPVTGIVETITGPRLEPDRVEVWFSKPMKQIPVDSTIVTISGGALITGACEWISYESISIQVTNMEPVSYSVSATSLTDLAGNAVYP